MTAVRSSVVRCAQHAHAPPPHTPLRPSLYSAPRPKPMMPLLSCTNVLPYIHTDATPCRRAAPRPLPPQKNATRQSCDIKTQRAVATAQIAPSPCRSRRTSRARARCGCARPSGAAPLARPRRRRRRSVRAVSCALSRRVASCTAPARARARRSCAEQSRAEEENHHDDGVKGAPDSIAPQDDGGAVNRRRHGSEGSRVVPSLAGRGRRVVGSRSVGRSQHRTNAAALAVPSQ